MSDPSSPIMENSMLAKCLDFSRQLISNKEGFKFEVRLSSGFSFTFNNQDQEQPTFRKEEVKKKSPSTLKRNATRNFFSLNRRNSLPKPLLSVTMKQTAKLA